MSVRSSDHGKHHASQQRGSVRGSNAGDNVHIVDGTGTSTASRMRRRMQAVYEEVMFERRVLLGCTASVGLAILLWLISVSTDYWFTVSAPTPQGADFPRPQLQGRVMPWDHFANHDEDGAFK
ncbi:hypothetical protein B566_EDAN012763 [Ephemera danica]|nr:hypothetical protein B566_EDAN012763 [Ephemera danica]